MGSVSLIKSRKLRVLALLLGFVVIMLLATFFDGAYDNLRLSSKADLAITREFTIPLREISAMFWQRPQQQGGSGKLFAVGDKFARLGVVDFNGRRLGRQEFWDFTPALIKRFAPCVSPEIQECHKAVGDLSSQWEGIAVDGLGKLFLLHEKFASIFVLSPDAGKLLGVMNLSGFFPKARGTPGQMPHNRDNALGEGLVLLNNGHFLVIKERFPPAVVEFGRAGEAPQGFSADLALAASKDFPLSEENVSYEPLQLWRLEDHQHHCDLSELTSSAAGELYVLSQQCKWIARLSQLRPQGKFAKLSRKWYLPEQLSAAESLVVVDEQSFLVAEDRRSLHKANVFLLHKKENETDREKGI